MCRGHRSLQGRQPSCQHLPGAYRGSGRFWQGAGVHAKANAIRRDPTVPPPLLCPALSCITSLPSLRPLPVPTYASYTPAHPTPHAPRQGSASCPPTASRQRAGTPHLQSSSAACQGSPRPQQAPDISGSSLEGQEAPWAVHLAAQTLQAAPSPVHPGGDDAGGCPSAAEPRARLPGLLPAPWSGAGGCSLGASSPPSPPSLIVRGTGSVKSV